MSEGIAGPACYFLGLDQAAREQDVELGLQAPLVKGYDGREERVREAPAQGRSPLGRLLCRTGLIKVGCEQVAQGGGEARAAFGLGPGVGLQNHGGQFFDIQGNAVRLADDLVERLVAHRAVGGNPGDHARRLFRGQRAKVEREHLRLRVPPR